MRIGTDAHDELHTYLDRQDPGQWQARTGLEGLFGGGIPDEIYTPRTGGALNVYELKPLGDDASASKQLQASGSAISS
jgi:hypothetical protein